MWIITKPDAAIEIVANEPTHDILPALQKANPGAAIHRSIEGGAYGRFAAVAFATVAVQGPDVEEIQEFDPLTGDKVDRAIVSPGPITIEPAGNTFALEGDRIVVRDPEGAELLALPVVLAFDPADD